MKTSEIINKFQDSEDETIIKEIERMDGIFFDNTVKDLIIEY